MSTQTKLKRVRTALEAVRLYFTHSIDANAAARLDRLRRLQWRLERQLDRERSRAA